MVLQAGTQTVLCGVEVGEGAEGRPRTHHWLSDLELGSGSFWS